MHISAQCPDHMGFLCQFAPKFLSSSSALVPYRETLPHWRDFLSELSRLQARLLVVSPFTDSIARNLPHLSQIHPSHNLSGLRVRLLRTPQTFTFMNRASNGSNITWLQTLERIRSSTEWDPRRSQVVLLGCGGYGMPLAAHAKQRGLSAVYVGGFLQLLFGIRGARWQSRPEMASELSNPYWTRVMPHELPSGNRAKFDGDGLKTGYWRL
jgi:hypothetical protein